MNFMCRSYAERDKYAADMDKLREELERVQVGIFGLVWKKIYKL
jgi:hypothetical protein